MLKKKSTFSAFTIIELLVVIVVIGVLATVVVVSYVGVNEKAAAASMKSDLANGSKILELYYVDHDSVYPQTMTDDGNGNYCPTPTDTKYCIKASSGNTLTYDSSSPYDTYTLTASNPASADSYQIIPGGVPTIVAVAPPISCPSGFIPVPGSATYGTSDFCVMKYEPKNVSGVATSQPSGTPWSSVTLAQAITYSQGVTGCTGCHLITEAEWMTLAQNILNISSNWSGNAVGSGYVYSGHSDAMSPLEASSNDSDGYYLTGNTAPSEQKRTLTLSNGEVIWDLAGNVYERTQGTINAGQQPGLSGESSFTWKEWNNGSLIQNGLPNLAMPISTGIANINTWGSSQKIGKLRSNLGATSQYNYIRGGASYYDGFYGVGSCGILALDLSGSTTAVGTFEGFRVTAPAQ